MSVSFCCPKCKASFHVSDEHAGKRAKCKKCGAPLRIPSLAAQAEAPPLPKHRTSGADAHDREAASVELPRQTPEPVPPPPASLRTGPAQRSTQPPPPLTRSSQPAGSLPGQRDIPQAPQKERYWWRTPQAEAVIITVVLAIPLVCVLGAALASWGKSLGEFVPGAKLGVVFPIWWGIHILRDKRYAGLSDPLRALPCVLLGLSGLFILVVILKLLADSQ